MTLKKKFQIWNMKRKARKYRYQMMYRCGDGGFAITKEICPGVAIAERKFNKCIDWLEKNDPTFPHAKTTKVVN